jgi:hypothetical protein
MTRRPAKPAAAVKAATPAVAAAPTPPALEVPDAAPLDVADLVADCERQRDGLLRDVYALTADQLEHLAYCTRILEQHRA